VREEPRPADPSVTLGAAGGVSVDWRPSVKGSPHLFILGIPGQGKSWTILRLLSQLGRQDVPALVLDFHGQFAAPGNPFARAVSPTVLDASRGLPFSPFEVDLADDGSGNWKAMVLAVAEIFGYVAGLGDMQRDVVYQLAMGATSFLTRAVERNLAVTW
jgi:DNA helicase HerA-like ATPase